jgi:hypothetical protein
MTRKLLVPLAAFLAARVLFAVAAKEAGYAPFAPVLWQRWDSGQYLSIARQGYDLVECSRIGYAPNGWCGNSGWMPAYPALIAGAVRLGAPPLPAAVAISAGFEIALLVLLWNGLFARKNPLALLACALAPGAVYFHAVFPVSMCAFFVALCLWLLLQDRFALAGLAGAAAAASYSSGFLVAPIAAAWALCRPGTAGQRLSRALLSGGIAAGGLVAVFAFQQATVGAWDAFLRVQAKYDHHFAFPLETMILQWRSAPRAIALQTVVVAVGMLALAAWRVAAGLRPRDALLLGVAALFWLFPLSLANVSPTRSEAFVLPALILLAEAPPAVAGAGCALLAALAFPVAQAFCRGVLV